VLPEENGLPELLQATALAQVHEPSAGHLRAADRLAGFVFKKDLQSTWHTRGTTTPATSPATTPATISVTHSATSSASTSAVDNGYLSGKFIGSGMVSTSSSSWSAPSSKMSDDDHEVHQSALRRVGVAVIESKTDITEGEIDTRATESATETEHESHVMDNTAE